MEVVSEDLALFNDQHGIALYVEKAISLAADEPIHGAVQASLTPSEAVTLGRALIAAAPMARATFHARAQALLQRCKQ